MLRICMQVADFIEQEVIVWLERIIQVIERVCRTVTEQIEQWQKRFEQRCEQVRRQVCRWLPWPLNKLCDWVTETVCKLVEVWVKIIVTVVKTVCEIVTSFIKVWTRVVLTIVVSVLRIVCFIVDFIINWIKIIFWAIVGLPEFLLCLLGLRIRKHLHVCVTVLADREGRPVVDNAHVSEVLREATRIISERMNVRVHEHGRKLVRVPDEQLDVTACNAGQLFSSEAIDLTSQGERRGRFGEILGCGDNLVDQAQELIHDVLNIIFIRDIREGDDVGCHIPGTDYVIIDRNADGLVLAHEIGHAGDLWHVSQRDNLMNHFTGGDRVHAWQQCIFRRSRFVVYAP
ncbi:hypothetical protein [Kallotenue papyrolyticum]|uniref:hypothetical protein n=1 Tax=Kallotenue papyrolyticum TaxID=1325125 RepID=UPI000492D637|nr:hypothetical protein [Kallotenue papyrolyticum]